MVCPCVIQEYTSVPKSSANTLNSVKACQQKAGSAFLFMCKFQGCTSERFDAEVCREHTFQKRPPTA